MVIGIQGGQGSFNEQAVNRTISDLYNLDVIDENLQDSKNNLTYFLLVENLHE